MKKPTKSLKVLTALKAGGIMIQNRNRAVCR